MKLVRKVGKLKQEQKMPIVDPAVEKKVIENFITSASDAGIEPDFAKRIANLLIEGSVEVQETMRPIDSVKAKVAVIGAGGMGSWFARFFKSRGSHVTVSDRDRHRARLLASRIGVRWVSSNVEAVMENDVVVLAIPANAVSKVVNEILPGLREKSLLVEICAVKSPVMSTLRLAEKRGVQVVSIHPLFGPLARGLRGKKVLIVRTGGQNRGSQTIRKLLSNARFFLTDPRLHDKQTALTLALPHFLNMAFAMTLSKRNVAEVRRFAGRTFDLQMLLAETVASEPETTADIQVMNKEFRSVLRELQRNINVLAGTVNRHDRTELVARYRQIREGLLSDPKFAFAGAAFERACEAASAWSEL
jgi:prephenate dehydrogenase